MIRCLTAAALLALSAAVISAAAEVADTKSAVAALKAVGREGKGNAEASAAWKKLVAAGRDAMPAILTAIADDDLTSANWLQPAFDAIAEKAVADGTFPTPTIKAAFTDTALSGTARKLAYDWLVAADPKSADALQVGKMTSDPAPQVRRLAVAAEMDRVKALPKAEARVEYPKLLKLAADTEQIDAIADALAKLDSPVDVAKTMGFVLNWHLVAPFDNVGAKHFDTVYPPEKGVDLKASYEGKDGKKISWAPVVSVGKHGEVDIAKALDKYKGAVAYAYATVTVPEDRTVEVRAACITALKVFVNGEKVYGKDEYHHGSFLDQHVARVKLKKGANTILLKVLQNEQKESWAQAWAFQLRLAEPVGTAAAFTQAAVPGAKPTGTKEAKEDE